MKTPVRKSKTSVPAAARRPQAVLVLGMHRSGTSALTRTLNLLGCALPGDLIGAGDGNEVGHWESVAAVTLNDEILASAGSSWEDWGPINEDWRNSGLKAEMLGRIQQVIEDHVALGPLFAIKDPRLCRVADLWLEAAAAADVEPHVLLMLRNPAEVCASLEQRDLMVPGYGQLLWLRHVLDAEYFSRGVPRIVCRYDQLMRNWHGVADRIKAGLGIALPRNAPAVHMTIDQFLSSQHRHHDLSPETVLGNSGLSSWIRRTYEILFIWGEQGENSADHAKLDQIRQEFDRSYSTFARLLMGGGVSGSVGSGSQLKRELSAQLESSRAALETATQAAEEAAAQQAAIAEREAQLQAQLEAGQAEARQLQAEIEVLQAERERAARLATELEAIQARETESVQGIARLETALQSVNAEVEQERQSRLVAEQALADRVAELHDLQLRNAELAGRVAAAESALVQRQEETAQLWNSVLAAEKQATAAESRAELERERQRDSERRLEAAEAAAADLRSRLDVALAAPPPANDILIAEMAQMTRLLQEQEVLTEAAAASRSEAEQALARQTEETRDLQAQLQQQEDTIRTAEEARSETERALKQQQDATRAADAARAATEQKLAARFDEIARITAMLADESDRAANSAANAEWLRNMMQQARRFPKWWALMPEQWRRQREHARYRRAGLFDADKYLRANPDVAAEGIDPVRHYILYGIDEGRHRPV